MGLREDILREMQNLQYISKEHHVEEIFVQHGIDYDELTALLTEKYSNPDTIQATMIDPTPNLCIAFIHGFVIAKRLYGE